MRGSKHGYSLYDVWPTPPLLQVHRDLLDEECESVFRALSLRFVMKGCRTIFLLCLNTTEERSDAGDLQYLTAFPSRSPSDFCVEMLVVELIPIIVPDGRARFITTYLHLRIICFSRSRLFRRDADCLSQLCNRAPMSYVQSVKFTFKFSEPNRKLYAIKYSHVQNLLRSVDALLEPCATVQYVCHTTPVVPTVFSSFICQMIREILIESCQRTIAKMAVDGCATD